MGLISGGPYRATERHHQPRTCGTLRGHHPDS